MKNIPQVPGIDNSLAFIADGYRFISKRCDRYQTDIFQTRLLFEKTICFRGKEAAQVFYDNDKFVRKKAMPKAVQKTLTGEGGVQGLDGERHRQRKQIFMALMTPERLAALADLVEQQWYRYAKKWERQEQVILFDQVEEILCRAVCEWSAVPLAESEVAQHTRELSTMISGSGRPTLEHFRARRARDRAEQWISSLIHRIRAGEVMVPAGTAAHAFAWTPDASGNLLDLPTGAVDLLNVLRPTVAIGRYIIFAALALHQFPDQRQQLIAGGADYIHLFTQEVRRFYPFFPAVAARVCQDFEWQGYSFSKGTQVLLDLYGTNHHPDLWEHPDDFRPERFRHWQKNSFDFIPQGGGDFHTNHRCAGEWLTIQVMERSLQFLVNHLEYQVPPQNLEFSLSTMPTLPKSRFRISNVKLR